MMTTPQAVLKSPMEQINVSKTTNASVTSTLAGLVETDPKIKNTTPWVWDTFCQYTNVTGYKM